MKKYFDVIKTAELFSGVETDGLEAMLKCLGAKGITREKGEAILLAGDKPEHVGLVLEGRLHITKDDYDGNRTLVATLDPGALFAEALCCAGIRESPVSVLADTDSSVMLLKFSRILHTCPKSCGFHTRLIANMLQLIARKNLYLQGRMELIGIKSVRAKIMRYLESFTPRQGRCIIVPLNRQEMAEYMCVDRSALSHELMRMKKEGIIDYNKNRFILIDYIRP